MRLSLFGSTVRGDRGSNSDIDLVAALDDGRRFSLLDVIHIENQIADLLGEEVDLLVEGTLKPHIQETLLARRSVPFSVSRPRGGWGAASTSVAARR